MTGQSPRHDTATNHEPHSGAELPDPADHGTPAAAVLAASDGPVGVRVALVEDERTPEGTVCMGTYRADQLIARCALSAETWNEVEEQGWFDGPVPIMLLAREAPPGLQCRLFAMLATPPESGAEPASEPWGASVPGAGYEQAVHGDEEAGVRVVPFPLGNIVRFARDRVHPDSLPLEAADVLRELIQGKTSELVDRALADLLGT